MIKFGMFYKPNTILRKYLKAYIKRDFKSMAKLTQITWASKSANPKEEIEKMLGNMILIDFEIGDFIYNKKEMAFDIPYIAKFKLDLPGEKIKSYSCSAMIIKETNPYKPNVRGNWGVNPISMLRRKLIEGNQ